jgi:hypothetical protein
MAEATFRQQLALTVVDKAVIGLLGLAVGFWLSVRQDDLKARSALAAQLGAENRQAASQLATENRQAAVQLAAQNHQFVLDLVKQSQDALAAAERERKRAKEERDKEFRDARREAERAGQVAKAQLEKEQRQHEEELSQEQRQFTSHIRELEASFGQRLAQDRDQRQLAYLATQLSEFYWPLYLRLRVDTALSGLLHGKWDGTPLEREVGFAIERDTVIPNHMAAVALINAHLNLVKEDDQLLDALCKYMKHVAAYRALRAAGSREDPSHIQVPYPVGPEGVEEVVKDRLDRVRKEYLAELEAWRRNLPSQSAVVPDPLP